MCGGTMWTAPCSHVGHIFRKRSPYSWSAGGPNPLKKNSVRLAEVWLDKYKTYYYERINNDLVRPFPHTHAHAHTHTHTQYPPLL